jgi:hypothetical protein
MKFKPFAWFAGQKLWNRYIDPLLCLLIALSIVIFCWQLPSWGKAGFSEWQDRTPGGNTIGNTENTVGVGLRGKKGGHLDRIIDYGFYDGVVIGTTKTTGKEQFFLFDEQTNKIEFFTTKQDLCKKVAGKSAISSMQFDFLTVALICGLWLWYSFCFIVSFIVSMQNYCRKHGKGLEYNLERAFQNPRLKFNLERALQNPQFERDLFYWALGIFISPNIINPIGLLFSLVFFGVLWMIVFKILLSLAKQILTLASRLSSRKSQSKIEKSERLEITHQPVLFIGVFIFGVLGLLLMLLAIFSNNGFRC